MNNKKAKFSQMSVMSWRLMTMKMRWCESQKKPTIRKVKPYTDNSARTAFSAVEKDCCVLDSRVPVMVAIKNVIATAVMLSLIEHMRMVPSRYLSPELWR